MPGQQPKLKRQLPLNQNTGREILSGIFFSLIFKKNQWKAKKKKKALQALPTPAGLFFFFSDNRKLAGKHSESFFQN